MTGVTTWTPIGDATFALASNALTISSGPVSYTHLGFGVGVEDGRAVVVGADFAACGAVGPLRHAVVVGPENAAAAVAEDLSLIHI